ncbi:MAG TPA: phosphotransferase [Candidatus Saccharimonadaceae bacterium]|nr:phosphotransferase [Candidatus Saccharimonadaceae bacterium]
MRSTRLAHPDLLADPRTLASLLGPVATLEREPISPPGFSGARFERVLVTLEGGAARSLILKRARFDSDWTTSRTDDTFGRAALPLEAPALDAIWEVYACPYVAHAVADGEVGLLMDDLGPHLLPDVRQPLEDAAEDALVGALANLHTRFWNSPALEEPRLCAASQLLGMLGPGLAREMEGRSDVPPVIERARHGWGVALARLPAAVARRLSQSPEDIARAWGPLPRTLLHGDAKVANFAILPDGRVAAFDWGLVGAGPAALDLGWYLAVNATRVRGTKEAFIARYRDRLETALGKTLPEALWSALVSAAIDAGALLLLWSKALALESGGAPAKSEWDWWVGNLERR